MGTYLEHYSSHTVKSSTKIQTNAIRSPSSLSSYRSERGCHSWCRPGRAPCAACQKGRGTWTAHRTSPAQHQCHCPQLLLMIPSANVPAMPPQPWLDGTLKSAGLICPWSRSWPTMFASWLLTARNYRSWPFTACEQTFNHQSSLPSYISLRSQLW